MQAFPREDMNWLYMGEPDPSRNNRVDIWPAGKIIGGGSAINGMMYVRGHSSDYDHWAELGNPGWAYKDVLPYFQRLENSETGDASVRGKQGPQAVSSVRIDSPLTEAFIAAAQEAGIPANTDLNGENQEGVGRCQATQKNGWRYSTARAYLHPVKQRKNLVVQHGAMVSSILIDAGRAKGVRYWQDGVEHTVTAAKGVVLAAGALASPKLLMLSGIGAADELSEHGIDTVVDLPGVGKHLLEHPVVRMSFHVKNARTLTSDLRNPFYSLQHGLDYLLRGRGALATCIGHAHALARTREDLATPNAQIIFAPLSYDLTGQGPKPYTRPAVGVGIGLCRIQSEGSISLRSNDYAAPPRIEYSLLGEPDDLAQLVEACQLARKIFSAPAFSRFYAGERIPGAEISTAADLEEYVRNTAALMYHPCGTCKMGVDDAAVVTPRLKVRGVEGLWVADASVFPSIPAGNINASCIMVGEKASDLIQEDSAHD